MKKNEMKITELYSLEHTMARALLEKYEYPWEALKHIGEFVKELGASLSNKEYVNPAEGIWIHKSAKVAPTAGISHHSACADQNFTPDKGTMADFRFFVDNCRAVNAGCWGNLCGLGNPDLPVPLLKLVFVQRFPQPADKFADFRQGLPRVNQALEQRCGYGF